MNNKPFLTIVSAIRNQEQYLPALLASISSQVVKNFEHIIVEGESTDKTPAILSAYKERNEHAYPITIHHKPPKGISDAMNFGIAQANGTWILVVHGDDYLIDSTVTARLEKQVLLHPKSRWLVGDTTRLFRWGLLTTPTYLIKPILFWLLPHYNLLNHQNMIMKKELFDSYGEFDANFKITMDLDFYLRLLRNNVKPTGMPGTFVVFRRHQQSASIDSQKVYFEIQKAKRTHFAKHSSIQK